MQTRHLWAVEHGTVPRVLPCHVSHYHPAVVVGWGDHGGEAGRLEVWGREEKGRGENNGGREREGEEGGWGGRKVIQPFLNHELCSVIKGKGKANS